jgi:hypothetical protein
MFATIYLNEVGMTLTNFWMSIPKVIMTIKHGPY